MARIKIKLTLKSSKNDFNTAKFIERLQLQLSSLFLRKQITRAQWVRLIGDDEVLAQSNDALARCQIDLDSFEFDIRYGISNKIIVTEASGHGRPLQASKKVCKAFCRAINDGLRSRVKHRDIYFDVTGDGTAGNGGHVAPVRPSLARQAYTA